MYSMMNLFWVELFDLCFTVVPELSTQIGRSYGNHVHIQFDIPWTPSFSRKTWNLSHWICMAIAWHMVLLWLWLWSWFVSDSLAFLLGFNVAMPRIRTHVVNSCLVCTELQKEESFKSVKRMSHQQHLKVQYWKKKKDLRCKIVRLLSECNSRHVSRQSWERYTCDTLEVKCKLQGSVVITLSSGGVCVPIPPLM